MLSTTLALLAVCAQAAIPMAPEGVALDYAAAELPAFQGHSLKAERVIPWAEGTTVRLAQYVNGVQVEGRDVIVNLDSKRRVRRSSGALTEAVQLNMMPTVPAATAEAEAARIADSPAPGRCGNPGPSSASGLDEMASPTWPGPSTSPPPNLRRPGGLWSTRTMAKR